MLAGADQDSTSSTRAATIAAAAGLGSDPVTAQVLRRNDGR